MNSRMLLVEGTCGTGKSTLIKHLLRRHCLEEEHPRALVHLSQAYTYFPLVSLPASGKARHRAHLRKILSMLTWENEELTPRKWFTFFVMLDTLHLTQVFRPGTLTWSEMGYVDRRLADWGAHLVFLRARPETLWQRLIVERGGDPLYFSHYQKPYGNSPEAVHAYYVKEQESMEALAKRSRMDTLVLEAEDSLEENLGKAYALWKG
jgi:deoxyadenosine/deoxycytidine kinase